MASDQTGLTVVTDGGQTRHLAGGSRDQQGAEQRPLLSPGLTSLLKGSENNYWQSWL